MAQQSIRQAARRAALDAQAQRRRERADRDKRIEALAVDVLTALEERKAAIAECERRAGSAVRHMTETEGLTLREVVDWCGPSVNQVEARRLLALSSPAEGVGRSGPIS